MRDFGLPEGIVLFKVSELSRLTSISAVQLKQLLRRGVLQGTKNGRDWLVLRESIIDYLNVGFKA